jgi:hypothetical protein
MTRLRARFCFDTHHPTHPLNNAGSSINGKGIQRWLGHVRNLVQTGQISNIGEALYGLDGKPGQCSLPTMNGHCPLQADGVQRQKEPFESAGVPSASP